MIVVTGAYGFIGSCLVSHLNHLQHTDIVVVDDFSKEEKVANLVGKKYLQKIERKDFLEWMDKNGKSVSFVFHIGARTDTTLFDQAIFDELNLNYSKRLWKQCVKFSIPMVYASSAATYGGGEHGYNDSHVLVQHLKPLNPYGDSKNDFDKWVLNQTMIPPFWAGLKFFNVYGPNEYHKGRMASVILHAFRQIKEKGEMILFQSHRPEYKDGEQKRDFIYVKDVVKIALFLMEERPENGLYNVGSGKARTFLDLAKSTFKAMDEEKNISFIPTPEDIRDKYQYFTEANTNKIITAGYTGGFHTLENGVEDYVKNYLLKGDYM